MRPKLLIISTLLSAVGAVGVVHAQQTDCKALIDDILEIHSMQRRYDIVSWIYANPTSYFTNANNKVLNDDFKLIRSYAPNSDLKEEIDPRKPSKIVKEKTLTKEWADSLVRELHCTPEQALEDYKEYVRQLKTKKDACIACIDAELAKGVASKYVKRIPGWYTYTPPSYMALPKPPYEVTTLDYFRLVKEFVLLNDEAILPDGQRADTYLQQGVVLATNRKCGLRGNPVSDGMGMTDPHVFVVPETGYAYMFATHDFSQDNKTYTMKDWWVWQSNDLVTWTQVSFLKPEQTFLAKPFNDCWATFGVYRNKQWYFYFSAGQNEVGVVTARGFDEAWKDPLGKALVPKGLTKTEQRDADVLIDDDGAAYMVYGTFEYFIVRLGEDMISLAETPRPVVIDRRFGPYGEGKTDDKPSLHKYNGKYYLSWCGFYAMSDNVYGPYQYKGALFTPDRIAPELQNKEYTLDRHGNIFTFNGQWYYTFNDFSRPGRSHYFRDAAMTYIHYLDNGEIAPVYLDTVGVGQYDARKPIEAENFFKLKNAVKRQCPDGGFEMRELRDSSLLVYPNVRNIPEDATLTFRYSSAHRGGARIEVYDVFPHGTLLGVCEAPETRSNYIYSTASVKLTGKPRSLTFLFRAPTDDAKDATAELLRLDSFEAK